MLQCGVRLKADSQQVFVFVFFLKTLQKGSSKINFSFSVVLNYFTVHCIKVKGQEE